MRTRFAPSPTGYLHLGHVHAALFANLHGRVFILRIEDIDPLRCRPHFTDAVFEDLAWLGLTWQQPVRLQSQHMDDYSAALDRLRAQDLLYPCFCTRSHIQGEIARAAHAPHGPDGPLYPGTCRSLSPSEQKHRMEAGQSFCLRLDVAKASNMAGTLTWTDRLAGTVVAQPQIFGDVVLARKDVPASYHLAVVVDDAIQDISLVTRGQDLLEATHIHRLLQALLGLIPPLYHHHPLILGVDGRRLAKRDQSRTIRSLRSEGYSAQAVKEMAGFP